MALELRGHVREAVESPHANYVIQKICEVLPSVACCFVAEELSGVGEAVARHRYGCRVICRLVEHQAMMLAVVEEIVVCAHYLCRNDFAKHVLKSIFEHGSVDQKRRVAASLMPNLVSNATHRSASYVVEYALELCEDADKARLADGLLQREAVLALATSQAGCHILRAVAKCTPQHRLRTFNLLRDVAQEVCYSKYGKNVLRSFNISDQSDLQ